MVKVIVSFETPRLWHWRFMLPWLFDAALYVKCCGLSGVVCVFGLSINLQLHWPHPYGTPHEEWRTLFEVNPSAE